MTRLHLVLLLAILGVGSAPAAVNWKDPEWTARRETAVGELSGLGKARDQEKDAVLAAAAKEWGSVLAERRRAGNVRGMAVATAALEMLNTARSALAEGKPVPWPETPRRELVEPLGKIRAGLDGIEQSYARKIEDARAKHREEFAKALAAAGADMTEDSMDRFFDPWISGQPMPDPARRGAGAPDPTGEPPAPGRPPPEIFAESGFGAQWKPLARWTARMAGPDVISIPVFDRPTESGSQVNPLTRESSSWTYESLSPLPPGVYVFRLKRMDDHLPVQVLSWPRNETEGALSVRTPNASQWPARVGFEIQYARTGDLIAVPVVTEPAGATIWVNGELYREGGEDQLTPCVLRLPAGTYEIRLRADGFQEAGSADMEIRPGVRMAVRLKPSSTSEPITLRIDPRAMWAHSGVSVRKGDRVRIAAEGEWAANSKDACGPDGYPNTLEYSHLYLEPRNSPRQIRDRAYGMLIGRIGDGKPFAVGSKGSFASPADGPLAFDINEIDMAERRRDNRGQLSVTITIIRPTP